MPAFDQLSGILRHAWHNAPATGSANGVPDGSGRCPAPGCRDGCRHRASGPGKEHPARDAGDGQFALRSSRVAVLGSDAMAAWCVLGLIRNGCATVGVSASVALEPLWADISAEQGALAEAGNPVSIKRLSGSSSPVRQLGWADLRGYDVVVVTGQHGPRQVLALLEQGVPAGRRLIPAWRIGSRVVVGPLMEGGRAGCWVCAALRLGANLDPGDGCDLWRGALPVFSVHTDEPVLDGPVSAVMGNLLAFEVFKAATGVLPAETDGQVLIHDTHASDTSCEPLLPHPRCLRCSGQAERVPLPTGLLEGWDGELHASETTDGTRDPERAAAAATERHAVLVQPHTGVLSGFVGPRSRRGPLRVGIVRLGLGRGTAREIAEFDPWHVARARERAVHRAAEAYVEHVVPPTGLLTRSESCRPTPLGRVYPHALAGFTRSEPTDVKAWCTAESVFGGPPVLVPAAAVRPLGPYNQDRLFKRTKAGMAAAGSLREAVLRGTWSALADEALEDAVRGAHAVAEVAWNEFAEDPEMAALAKAAADLGTEVRFLELGNTRRCPIPVILAHDGSEVGARWSVAGAPRRRRAVATAARDLLGRIQLEQDASVPRTWTDRDGLQVPDFAPGALTGRRLRPVDDRPRRVREVFSALREAGRDVLVAPASAEDLAAGGVFAARVLLTAEDAEAW